MIYEEKFIRNAPILSKSQQEKIKKSVFAIVGLGGVGGFVLENLARLGAINFILFDHDRFELTNFNRQLLATNDSLDQKKVDVAYARAKSINSKIHIRKFKKFKSPRIDNADIVIDATDNLESKLEISTACRSKKIPYVFCSAEGSFGIVSVFTNYSVRKAFAIDESKMKHKSRDLESRALDELHPSRYCTSILSPTASLAGSLAATEALNQIIKKPLICAPNALFFDIFDKRIFWRGKLG
jgi:molybdopterin/thiamine biosynthesis adenylyltransferase